MTLHVLAASDAQPHADDAWEPAECDEREREHTRTGRVLAAPTVAAAETALSATFASDDDLEEGSAYAAAVHEAALLLPVVLVAHGVVLADDFAVAARNLEA